MRIYWRSSFWHNQSTTATEFAFYWLQYSPGMQWIIRANFHSSGKLVWLALVKNIRELSTINSGSTVIDKYLSSSSSAPLYSSLNSPDSYSSANLFIFLCFFLKRRFNNIVLCRRYFWLLLILKRTFSFINFSCICLRI